MKAGIVTIHRASNYGAVLQAYALKETLRKRDVPTDIIDYRCSFIEEFYLNPFAKFFGTKTKIKNALTWHIQKARNAKFKPFIENYLNCTEAGSVYTHEELLGLNEKYDVFISGSDQIWNPVCTGGDKAYFLEFVQADEKKYSYAASLGNISAKFAKSEVYKELLSQYSELSVREKKGQAVVQEMTNRKASVHLDPTFLLEKKDWEYFVKPVEKKKYLLIYSIAMPKTIEDFAVSYAKQHGLEVVYITLNNLFTLKKRKNVITCTPEEFLSYMFHADCVVTNSFHGVAFSIIFNKKFYVEKNANPNHDNSRLENILDCMGLSERFIENGIAVAKNDEIDYRKTNDRIEALRAEALAYLDRIVKRG